MYFGLGYFGMAQQRGQSEVNDDYNASAEQPEMTPMPTWTMTFVFTMICVYVLLAWLLDVVRNVLHPPEPPSQASERHGQTGVKTNASSRSPTKDGNHLAAMSVNDDEACGHVIATSRDVRGAGDVGKDHMTKDDERQPSQIESTAHKQRLDVQVPVTPQFSEPGSGHRPVPETCQSSPRVTEADANSTLEAEIHVPNDPSLAHEKNCAHHKHAPTRCIKQADNYDVPLRVDFEKGDSENKEDTERSMSLSITTTTQSENTLTPTENTRNISSCVDMSEVKDSKHSEHSIGRLTSESRTILWKIIPKSLRAVVCRTVQLWNSVI